MTLKYVGDDNPDGSVLGTDSGSKVGFFGATPVAQQSAITANAGTLSTTATQVNSILTALRNLGFVAT